MQPSLLTGKRVTVVVEKAHTCECSHLEHRTDFWPRPRLTLALRASLGRGDDLTLALRVGLGRGDDLTLALRVGLGRGDDLTLALWVGVGRGAGSQARHPGRWSAAGWPAIRDLCALA